MTTYAHYNTPCDCSFDEIDYHPIPCTSDCVDSSANVVITQKRIWNQVRVPTSLYTMNLAALNVVGAGGTGENSNAPRAEYSYVNWNQYSDRARPAGSTPGMNMTRRIVPSHGNSTRATLTAHRPGASAPGGKGVDVKHGSYARYLARKKGNNLRTGFIASAPKQGNKTQTYNIIARDNMPGKNCACGDPTQKAPPDLINPQDPPPTQDSLPDQQ